MKKAKYYFLPYSEPAKNPPYEYPVIGFDTETDKAGNFIIGCTYGERFVSRHVHKKGTYSEQFKIEKVVEENVFYDEASLQDYLLKLYYHTNKNHPAAIICGFNLNYDANYIFPIIKSPLIANGEFIGGKTYMGIRIYDLTKHVDGSLANWIEHLKMNDSGIVKTKWYDNMPLAELIYHCQNDAKATWYLGRFIQNFYINVFSMKMNYTVGSAAMKIIRKHYFHDAWMRYYDDFNIFERKAFRGGRTETFRKGKFLLTTYDINSMYLSIMHTKKIPNPNAAVWGLPSDFDNIRKNYDYIVEASIYVPKQYIAPLPFYDEKMKKMLFPCGYFTGYFCSPELEYALRNCNVEILKIHKLLYYTESKPYFHDFADYIWKRRLIFKENGNRGMELMVKKIGNSSYGKFGETDELSGLFIQADYQRDLTKHPDKHVGEAILEFRKDNNTYVKTYGKSVDSWHTFPVVVCFITSYGRLMWLEKIKPYEDSIVYGDTDSAKLPEGVPFISGSGLGDWKNEGTEELEIKRPKFYLKFDESGFIDVEKSKIGGVPKRAIFLGIANRDSKKFKQGDYGFRFEKPVRFGESVRKFNKHHIMTWNKWNTQEKWISPRDNKRVWLGNESEPIFLNKS